MHSMQALCDQEGISFLKKGKPQHHNSDQM